MKQLISEAPFPGTVPASSLETILVLHVRKGYESRSMHIKQMMDAHGLKYHWILDGDISDLTDGMLKRYFTGGTMLPACAQTSCAMKHFLACSYILEHRLKGALILEDDAVLYRTFDRIFPACMVELETRGLRNALVSFEDSSLHLVPRSERKKGQHLYAHGRDRFTGAYYCTNEAAALILDYVEAHKCDLPIDRFHTALISRAGLNYYWCHPCIATQGTHSGLFSSSIDSGSAHKQRYRRMTWLLKLGYKKLVALLR